MTKQPKTPASSILAGLTDATAEDVAALRKLRERLLSPDEIYVTIMAMPSASEERLRARPNTLGEPFSLKKT